MTDVEPTSGSGPLDSVFSRCATHNLYDGKVTITCNNEEGVVRGRYLFVAVNVSSYFTLREVEVFEG